MLGGARMETQWYCWRAGQSVCIHIFQEIPSGSEEHTPPAKGILSTHQLLEMQYHDLDIH